MKARCRWPLEPLLVTCTYQAGRDPTSTNRYRGRLALSELADRLGVSADSVRQAASRGCSDTQADHWAIAAGLHPASVWGWDAWVDAALARHEVDDLVPKARRIAQEIAAEGRPVRQRELLTRLRATGERISPERVKALWAELGIGRVGSRGRPTWHTPKRHKEMVA